RPAEARQREVVKVETSRTKLYVALVTLCAAVLLLGAGTWMFLTSQRKEIKSLREGLSAAGSSAENPLDAGLSAFAAGDWPKARESFATAARTAEPGSEAEQWAKVNLASALVLEGRRDQAREIWAQLERGGLYSDREENLPRANLFLDAAAFGLRPSPLTVPDVARYPQTGVGALVYFFAGVANRGLGDNEAARAQFAKFLAVPADKNVPYWNSYRAAAEKLSAP
ncbi:MAG: hypothetical protein ACKOEG_11425, partial [Chthoniobacterales bacterium]